MLKQVEKALHRPCGVQAGDHIVAGVSGGADSMALLCVLNELRSRLGFKLTTAHLDHGLRGAASREDARHVGAWCRRLDIPFRTGTARVQVLADNRGWSLEMAARHARHTFFKKVLREVGGNCVALAHNRNDQAETLLLQLLRGNGPGGLGGMAPVAELKGLRLIRPLLEIERVRIEQYLRRKDVPWREDASNREDIFLRNRIRHQVLPVLQEQCGEAVPGILARTADRLRLEGEWIGGLVKEALEGCMVPGRPNVLSRRDLAAAHPALQLRILQHWLAAGGVPHDRITRDLLSRLGSLAASGRGSARVPVSGELEVQRAYDRLTLSKVKEQGGDFRYRISLAGEVEIPELGLRVLAEKGVGVLRERGRVGRYPVRASLSLRAAGRAALWLRNVRPGDRIRPLGMRGTRKLQDLLVDCKIPRAERVRIPVLECRGEVVWVPGYAVARGWEVADHEKALHLSLITA